jgi:hypothetical protein
LTPLKQRPESQQRPATQTRFTMIGLEAGEVVAVVQTAMLAGLPYTELCDAILAHPTMVEGLGSLFSNVPPRSGQ